MTAYKWVKQGNAFGLKPLNGIGNVITEWVVPSTKGKQSCFYEVSGQYQDGVVHGSHKTKRAAMRAVEDRLDLAGVVCAHCGSKMVQH